MSTRAHRAGSRWRSDVGQATVEVFGAMVLVAVFCVAAFQILAFGYGAVMADNAVEAAALAHANGDDARAAATEALPGWPKDNIWLDIHGDQLRLALRTPVLLPGLDGKLVTRSKAVVRTSRGSR